MGELLLKQQQQQQQQQQHMLGRMDIAYGSTLLSDWAIFMETEVVLGAIGRV